MSTCTLFSGATRVNIKLEDLTVARIARIFQVSSTTLYMKDEEKVAIFPLDNGYFSLLDVAARQHYEVHGVAEDTAGPAPDQADGLPRPTPGRSFAFQRPAAAAAGSGAVLRPVAPRANVVKPFQKTVFLAELISGKWTPQQSVPLRFYEYEASVPGLLTKVQESLGTEDRYIIADSQGMEIVDCDATKGSDYWMVSAKKVLVMPEQEFLESKAKKRRLSRRENHSQLPEVVENIEDLVLAAQELADVTQAFQDLTEFASSNRKQTASFTEQERAALKNSFACLVCKGPMDEPCFSTCCKSLIACRACLDQWLLNSSHCLKCRADDCRDNVFTVDGIGGALFALDDLMRD